MLKQLHCLVTGGLGFIGSHLVSQLLAVGDKVTIIDSLEHNVIPPTHFHRVKVRCGRVYQFRPLDRLQADIIFHLGAPCGVCNLTVETVRAMAMDAQALLGAAERVVAFSTSEAIGQAGHNPDETTALTVTPPYSLRSQYQVGKLALECILLGSGQPGVQVIRPFNVVGRGQRVNGGFVLPRFVEQAKQRRPLTVFGDGTQRRSFVSVDDVVDFCMMLRHRPPPDSGIWHIGNPKNTVSIAYLAKLVNSAVGSDAGVAYVPSPASSLGLASYEEAPAKDAVIDKAEAYGWSLKRTLEQIVAEVVK